MSYGSAQKHEDEHVCDKCGTQMPFPLNDYCCKECYRDFCKECGDSCGIVCDVCSGKLMCMID